MKYLDQILHACTFYHCPVTGIQNGYEAMPSIRLATGRGQLVKTLITLELHGIFCSNFAYLTFNSLCKTVTRLRQSTVKPSICRVWSEITSLAGWSAAPYGDGKNLQRGV